MALKAIFCLLSVSLANAMYTNPSLSSSLAGNIESLLSGPVPCTDDSCLSKCLKTLKGMRMETTTWDKEYNFAKLGLKIKLNYVDPAVSLTGAQVAVEFAVPELLRFFTFGVTELTLDAVLEAPKIMEGLFNVKIGYTAVRNDKTLQGVVNLLRVIEAGKYVTKFYMKDRDMDTLGMTISTDMMNKNMISVMYHGETYALTLNRVRGNSLVASVNYKGSDYSMVVSPNMQTQKISVTISQNKSEVIYKKEIIYNPISSEYGVYVDGDGQYGPLSCRFIVQKDLSFVQISVSHNQKTIVYLNMYGRMQMTNTIPNFFKYVVTYDFLEGIYGEGRAKINFNAMDAQKVLSVKVAPKIGSSYDFELKFTVEKDFSYEIMHELTQDTNVLYTASHKHTVAFNTAEKWSSIQKDKCVIPKNSSLFLMVKDTYLGSILIDMQRTMAINIDWRSKTGMMPKVHYEDSILANGEKHMALTMNTMEVPFKLHLTYPVGPTIMGMNFGLLNLLGQDSVTCAITYTPGRDISITSDFDDMKATIRLPSSHATTSLSLDVTKTKQNEKVVEISLIKEGETIYKVNTFANIKTPNMPYICTSNKGSCQWSALLNFEFDLSSKLINFQLLPINTFTMSLTKDLETLLEIQQNMKTSPYFIRMTCPTFLPQPLDITIKHENKQSMTVTVANYIPGDITVDIVGTKNIVKYEGHELAIVDIDMANKYVSFGIALLDQPMLTLQYTTNKLFNNRVTLNVHLPILGNIMTITKSWMVKTLNDFSVKANLVALLPVVGKIESTIEMAAVVNQQKGSVKLNVHGHFTEGLVTYLPHVDIVFTTIYHVQDMTLAMLLHVNDIIISLPPTGKNSRMISEVSECTFHQCTSEQDGGLWPEGECQPTYCQCSNGRGHLMTCADQDHLAFSSERNICDWRNTIPECKNRVVVTGPYPEAWTGTAFDDVDKRENGKDWPIEAVQVMYKGNSKVHGLNFIYNGNQEGGLHGGKYSTSQEGFAKLNKNENIVEVEFSIDLDSEDIAKPTKLLQHITFITNEGRSLGPYGTEAGTTRTVKGGDNCILSYISGRSGMYIDGIAFWWECRDL